jgi:hypothetical protein
VLGEAGAYVDGYVEEAAFLTTEGVSEGADEGSEDHGGAEASNEEDLRERERESRERG